MGKKKTLRAGFIPFYIENDQIFIYLMKPSNSLFGGDRFQIAKGRVEDGETMLQAALREANEELGLKESNLLNADYLGTFLGYTDIYYGEVKNKTDFDTTTYETGETCWMSTDDFFRLGRTIHFNIVREFIKKLNES